jgi:hypothetical protein
MIRVMTTVLAVLTSGLVSACAMGPETGVSEEAARAAPSVDGTGAVYEDFPYSTHVSARLSPTGEASGEIVSILDVSQYGLGLITVTATVDCLEIDGNVAWVSGSVVDTTNPDVLPLGLELDVKVVDNGSRGDAMHSEPEAGGCHSRPDLQAIPLLHGNYVIH